jgi:hypothetical protein
MTATPDEQAVERVAKAIEQVDRETRDIGQLPAGFLFREMARAAIAALAQHRDGDAPLPGPLSDGRS